MLRTDDQPLMDNSIIGWEASDEEDRLLSSSLRPSLVYLRPMVLMTNSLEACSKRSLRMALRCSNGLLTKSAPSCKAGAVYFGVYC